jgi:hypothetical protein
MIKTLALLALLDYSGSMDQKFSGKVKIEIMQKNIQGLLAVQPAQDNVELIIFGAEPQKKCQDLSLWSGSAIQVQKKLSEVKPGAFGRTPLSAGLLSLTHRALETKTSNVFVLTDGADSCQQNPCETLVKVNEKFKKTNQKLNLVLIAFDLKRDQKKFECFKNLKLSNLTISLIEAQNENEIYNQLKKIQAAALGLSEELDQEDKESNDKLDHNDSSQKGAGVGGGSVGTGAHGRNKKNTSKSQGKKKLSSKEGVLEILGAPLEAKFQMVGVGFQKSWTGAFPLTVPVGEYKLQFIDEWGLEIPLVIEPQQIKRIYWASLMKNAKTLWKFQQAHLGVVLTPTASTQEVHGVLQKLEIGANLNSPEVLTEVPFGEWGVEITHPIWLKGIVSKETLKIPRGPMASQVLVDFFKEELRWVKNPKSEQMSILEIQINQQIPERFLISPGTLEVPVPKNAEAAFLTGS